MKAGRPTDYDEDMVQAVYDYLESYEGMGHVVPTIAGLSRVMKVSRDTIWRWSKDENKSQFSDAIAELEAEQELKTISGSMTGDYNATISKLILTKHGYSDKTQQEVSGPNGGAVKTESTWVIQPVKVKGD